MVAGDSRIALFTVNGLRQDASYGCLSHSSGPGEQVGVSQPLRLAGVYQCLGDVILADDILKYLRTPLSGQHFISHIQPSQSYASGLVPVLSDGQIVNGGERGIRTLGTTFSWYTRFPVALLRPTRTSLRNRFWLWRKVFYCSVCASRSDSNPRNTRINPRLETVLSSTDQHETLCKAPRSSPPPHSELS